MITREQAVQLAKETHSYRSFGHAFVLELITTIVELHDACFRAYLNGARAALQGDIDPEEIPEENNGST